MKVMLKIFVLLLIESVVGTAYAETSLWRISKNGRELLLGGTVHLLSQSDYPLPDEFEQAFRESDSLVLEADLDRLNKPEMQALMVSKLLYPDSTRLSSHLLPATCKALKKYSQKAGVNYHALQKMKPSMVVITLTIAKLNQLGMAGKGVDQFFLTKAKSKHMAVSGLESAEMQIKTLEEMGRGKEDDLILSTLKDLGRMTEFMDEMKRAWRLGNMSALEETGIKPMKDEFPNLNKQLLVQRNTAWMPKITHFLNSPGRELILVGALHLAGDDGLLAQLKKDGVTVEQY
jgi:uncharacterized protein YbaP (TraB family)